jgi:hypothetical protein
MAMYYFFGTVRELESRATSAGIWNNDEQYNTLYFSANFLCRNWNYKPCDFIWWLAERLGDRLFISPHSAVHSTNQEPIFLIELKLTINFHMILLFLA